MMNDDTKILGVIGNPISHSLSPAMQNAAIKHLSLNYKYLAFNVTEENLKYMINSMTTQNIVGLNVTIPHKVKVMEYLDDINEEAKAIGAVNTIMNDGVSSTGYNTDIDGILIPIKTRNLKPDKVAIIGAGGAAKAAVYALSKQGSEITVINRSIDRANKLKEEFKELDITVYPINEISVVKDVDMIINATSVGMNTSASIIPKELIINQVIFDFVYTPLITKLQEYAKEKGCITIQGWEMLLHQGAKSFELWTGKKAPIEVMKKILLENLK